jgi:chromosome segregation ATPase
MSFSAAEDAVLSWTDIPQVSNDADDADDWISLQKQKYLAEDSRKLYRHITTLQSQIGSWVERKVESVEDLENQASRDQDELQTLHSQFSEAYQSVNQSSQDILSEERSHVMEAIKDIEVLEAKLEYEINALVSKVEDVEDGVAQFEGQVNEVEDRAAELEKLLKTESWLHWAIRSTTGLGTKPHLL